MLQANLSVFISFAGDLPFGESTHPGLPDFEESILGLRCQRDKVAEGYVRGKAAARCLQTAVILRIGRLKGHEYRVDRSACFA